jgi:fructose-1,6-bisphosphatase/inositol monophosphatase family enzyme
LPELSRAERFVRTLEPALRQAAAIARALEGRVANRPKAGVATAAKAALTIADTASQEALLVPLLARFASARLAAEEDTPSVGRFRGDDEHALIVVDPIDGTLSFYLRGRGPYAVMAGLALDGRYEAGLLALPREDLFFQAVRGGGARMARSGGPFEPARPAPAGRGVLASDGVPAPVCERLRAAGYEVGFGAGGAVAVAPLVPGFRAGLRLARTGPISRQGRIGALIAREAGARVCTPSGEPFPESIDEPAAGLLVAATPEDVEALRRAISGAT